MLLCFNGSSDDAPEETNVVLQQLASQDSPGGVDWFADGDLLNLRIKTRLVITRGDDPDVDTRLGILGTNSQEADFLNGESSSTVPSPRDAA